MPSTPIPSIDYEGLYRDVLPSVVSIYSGDNLDGTGSGFVFDGDGHVVTNQHVVGDRTRVEVRFADGAWRKGRVVGTDPYTDLAVVNITDLPTEARPLPVAEVNPAPGRPVAALGNPLGLDGSITAGIVSGANRSMSAGNAFAIPDVVQTDAAINPGNSGGPLVASAESGYEVVGVNRAKQGDNIGFAVSPALISRVVPALITTGRIHHPYLRIRTVDVTPRVAEANGLAAPSGVLVVESNPSVQLHGRPPEGTRDGRATPVGGDVIVGIDGQELHSHEELTTYLITKTAPGETVRLTVIRDGTEQVVQVKLDERPAPPRRRQRPPSGRQIPIE